LQKLLKNQAVWPGW